MKLIIYFTILSSTVMTSALAEEAAHESSIMDLKYPLVNFIILLAILSKVVKPLREKFNKQSDDVKSLMDSAARNNKDAEERLQNYQTKIKGIDSELAKISSDYENDVTQFSKNSNEETQTTITRMKRDLENKLEGEKKELFDDLNRDLLNKVIASTQSTIKSNKDYQSKATQKIVSELR